MTRAARSKTQTNILIAGALLLLPTPNDRQQETERLNRLKRREDAAVLASDALNRQMMASFSTP